MSVTSPGTLAGIRISNIQTKASHTAGFPWRQATGAAEAITPNGCRCRFGGLWPKPAGATSPKEAGSPSGGDFPHPHGRTAQAIRSTLPRWWPNRWRWYYPAPHTPTAPRAASPRTMDSGAAASGEDRRRGLPLSSRGAQRTEGTSASSERQGRNRRPWSRQVSPTTARSRASRCRRLKMKIYRFSREEKKCS